MINGERVDVFVVICYCDQVEYCGWVLIEKMKELILR